MKLLITTLFISFLVIHANGQNSNQLLGYVIHKNSLKDYHNVIVAELDSSIVKFTLRNLKSDKRMFKSIDTSSAKISLTSKEKKFLINSLEKQFDEDWTKEDFGNIEVIKQSQVKEYIKENKQNGFIYISAPVFIRDNSIALVFFANFHGEMGDGINNLAFYKLENGSWKKWITIEAGIYN